MAFEDFNEVRRAIEKGCQPWTHDRLISIFDPFMGERNLVHEEYVIWWHEIGAVTTEIIKLNSAKPLPEIALDGEKVYYQAGSGTEGDGHKKLKIAAWHWLCEMGDPHPRFEYYYIDVYSEKLKIPVQCGHTRVSDVYDYIFENGRFALAPYAGYDGESQCFVLLLIRQRNKDDFSALMHRDTEMLDRLVQKGYNQRSLISRYGDGRKSPADYLEL